MAIKYPGGRPYKGHSPSQANHNPKWRKKQSFSNRGMSFEDKINQSNDYYLKQDKAAIYKKPIPIQVVSVDYPKRSAAVIREAYYRTPSTTDYNGVYRGYYLDFEAKETKQKTAFPLSNFQQHQIDHFRSCAKHGGICFVLLSFISLDKIFLLDAEQLFLYWDRQFEAKGRKSIAFTELEANSILIQKGLFPPVPYLEAVDELINKKESRNV